jgi:hypothetical protein
MLENLMKYLTLFLTSAAMGLANTVSFDPLPSPLPTGQVVAAFANSPKALGKKIYLKREQLVAFLDNGKRYFGLPNELQQRLEETRFQKADVRHILGRGLTRQQTINAFVRCDGTFSDGGGNMYFWQVYAPEFLVISDEKGRGCLLHLSPSPFKTSELEDLLAQDAPDDAGIAEAAWLKVLAKYDKNHNGRIDGSEIAAMQADQDANDAASSPLSFPLPKAMEVMAFANNFRAGAPRVYLRREQLLLFLDKGKAYPDLPFELWDCLEETRLGHESSTSYRAYHIHGNFAGFGVANEVLCDGAFSDRSGHMYSWKFAAPEFLLILDDQGKSCIIYLSPTPLKTEELIPD